MTIGWSELGLSSRQYVAVAMLVALVVIAIPASFLCWAHSQGRLVAPALSGNVCFDEKVRFLRNRPSKECDVLVIGSSMALNNIDSEAMLKHLRPGTRLLNAGAWNMKIGQTRALLECLLQVYRPRSILFLCGPMDFYLTEFPSDFFDAAEVTNFIKGSSYWVPVFLRHFDLKYYVKWSFSILQDRSSRNGYFSVMFDRWGSIPLTISFPNVSWPRWSLKVELEKVDSTQYDELARIADLVRNRGINLICIQPPMRRDSVPVDATAAVDEHWRHLERILASRGFHLWNLSAMGLSDDYFCDYSHLNARGAPIFSEILGRETDSEWRKHSVASTQSSPIP
jgi:hypothetical protein